MTASEFEAIDKAVKLAIDHIITNGTDDIFRRPMFSESYELAVIRDKKDDFEKVAHTEAISFLRSCNLSVKRVGPIHRCMVPKDQYSFRNVHWIDPFDLVKYLSLAIISFKNIEKSRLPVENEVVHSHRRSSDQAQLFAREFGYKSFREKSGAISKEMVGKWKVATDISVFFDRIGNHHIENHLLDAGCEKKYVNLLVEILLQWAGDRRSHGIPVGCDASRIISEAALVLVDRKLIEQGIQYVRYVDDFRIFANTRAEAYRHLRRLSELLMDEGLFLKHKKTFISKIVAAEVYNEAADKGLSDEHEVIDEKKRVVKDTRIRVSGRSTLSRRYVEPGKDAIRKISQLSKQNIIHEYQTADVNNKQDLLKLAIKFFVYVEQDLEIINSILQDQITSIIYVVDAITKEADRFTDDCRRNLKDCIFTQMGGIECDYPFFTSLLKFFASRGFEDDRCINHVVDHAKLMDNQLFLREAIFLGYEQLDRFRIRKLAVEVFPAVSLPTQRAIYFAITRYTKMDSG